MDKEVQFWKQASPKLVTLGRYKDVKLEQLLKQLLPKLIALDISIVVNLLHCSKQYCPKLVALGNDTFAKFVHFLKQYSLTLVILGNDTDVKVVFSSYTLFTIFANASFHIFVTGIPFISDIFNSVAVPEYDIIVASLSLITYVMPELSVTSLISLQIIVALVAPQGLLANVGGFEKSST